MKKITLLLVFAGFLILASGAGAQSSWSLKMTVPLEPGIVCNNIDTMLKFYTGVLGLKLVADAQTTPEMSTRFGATPPVTGSSACRRLSVKESSWFSRTRTLQSPIPFPSGPMSATGLLT